MESSRKPENGRPPNPPAFGFVTLIALGSVATNASADLVTIAWDGNGKFERTLSIAPGKFAEVCGRLRKGLEIQWTFSAQAPTEFNIHYHEAKDVIFPAKQSNVSQLSGELRTTVEQDYCWMWTNKASSSIDVRLALKR